MISNRNTPKNAQMTGPTRYNRLEELGKHTGGSSRSESEADSLLDLYSGTHKSGDAKSRRSDLDVPENMYRRERDDPEGWIHRDKLAKIESEELQAAGINLGNSRRNVGRGQKVSTKRDAPGVEAYKSPVQAAHNDKRQRVASPVTEEAELQDQDQWDLRSPKEITAESTPVSPAYSNPVLRKTGSRIPILTSSPLPIPQDRVERDTPLPRKRTMSGSLSPDGPFMASGTRHRRNSAGSQALLDEVDGNPGSPSSPAVPESPGQSSSPIKVRNTTSPSSASVRKNTPHARKVSATPKSGTLHITTSSPGQRPGTRSGEVDRPRTAVNRPEGDPPWLATMYKPDPRLPPDQQIIPTHARRQQQAQWNEEGAIPVTYGRDFTPLSVRPAEEQPTPIKPVAPALTPPEKADDNTAWPLKSMPSGRSTDSGRAGTSGSTTGGYSTMPKIASPPVGVGSPKLSSSIQSPRIPNAPPQRMPEQRPEVNEKEEKVSKGCGCCLVM